jgi:hypothetical protein
VSPASLQTFIDTRLTLTPSVLPNSNYVIVVSDWSYLKHSACFCIVIIRWTETFVHPVYFIVTWEQSRRFKTDRPTVEYIKQYWVEKLKSAEQLTNTNMENNETKNQYSPRRIRIPALSQVKQAAGSLLDLTTTKHTLTYWPIQDSNLNEEWSFT